MLGILTMENNLWGSLLPRAKVEENSLQSFLIQKFGVWQGLLPFN